jgi:transposase
MRDMDAAENALPDDIDALKREVTVAWAAAAAAEARAAMAQAEATRVKAERTSDQALIAHMKLAIEKLRRELYGQRSERGGRLLDQMELQLEELEATAAEDALAAQAAARTTKVAPFERRRPARKPLPEHLPRERVVIAAPASCPCCGGSRLSKLGEDITETLEVIPRQWKVIQTVRERFACRDCEAIAQPPAPFHVVPRGLAGPSLLAMILFEKFGQHQPLNRQAERYAREGVPISLSTLADHVGACTHALRPLFELIETHVMSAQRLHADDTHIPVLAKGKCDTGRLWTYVRDDRPFGGPDPPAAVHYYSRDRTAEHPVGHLAKWSGVLQADAYAGFGQLYESARRPAPILEAACWAHARRKFFVLADIAGQKHRKTPIVIAPLALEAVRRIDPLFDIERTIAGESPEERRRVRQMQSAPLVAELEAWMRAERPRLARGADTAKAMDYMLRRWPSFARFLTDGRICLSNNAAERTMRPPAMGRKAWLFAGSDRGGERAAMMFSLIATAKLNDVDPQAWLANVLARIADQPASRLHELLPWYWKAAAPAAAAA